MGDRAAEGAAVADLEVADERRRPGEQRDGGGHLGGRLDGGLGRAGADPEVAVAPLDRAQLLDPTQVDEVVEDGQAQGEHRHEALAAGEHLGGVAELGEQPDGLVDGRRRVVVERRRLHVATGPSRRAGQHRRRVIGRRVMSAPMASATALITAGGAPMAPPSPTPL